MNISYKIIHKLIRGLSKLDIFRNVLIDIVCAMLNEFKYNAPDINTSDIHYLQYTFSQFGEDRIFVYLARKYGIQNGYYVDIGCFHPVDLSNTHLLYKMGWRGINIDISDEKIDLFDQLRPDDVNLVSACWDSTEMCSVVKKGGIGARDKLVFPYKTNNYSCECSDELMETQTLDEVLQKTQYAGKYIDILDIDCEGADINILKGLNFNKYQPSFVAVELCAGDEELSMFMCERGYSDIAVCGVTVIYENTDYSKRYTK